MQLASTLVVISAAVVGVGAVGAVIPTPLAVTAIRVNSAPAATPTVPLIPPTGVNSASHADDLPPAAAGFPCVPHGTLFPQDVTSNCADGTTCIMLLSELIGHSNPRDSTGDFYYCVKASKLGEPCSAYTPNALTNSVDPKLSICEEGLICSNNGCIDSPSPPGNPSGGIAFGIGVAPSAISNEDNSTNIVVSGVSGNSSPPTIAPAPPGSGANLPMPTGIEAPFVAGSGVAPVGAKNNAGNGTSPSSSAVVKVAATTVSTASTKPTTTQSGADGSVAGRWIFAAAAAILAATIF